MIYDKILHILYIFEIISYYIIKSNHNKEYIQKIIIYIITIVFFMIINLLINKLEKYKIEIKELLIKNRKLYDKYDDLINLYNEKIDIINELNDELCEYNIPLHIKNIYVDYLISEKHVCSICLCKINKTQNLFLTLCGHLFHEKCIKNKNNSSNKCPNCRYIININNEEYVSNDEEIINNYDLNLHEMVNYIYI